MTKNIKLPDELAQKLGKYTNKDETWADGLARAFAHMDEDAAIEDRNNRETVYSESTTDTTGSETQLETGDHPFDELGDGTTVRHKYHRGDYAGDVVEGKIQGEKLLPRGMTKQGLPVEQRSSPTTNTEETTLEKRDGTDGNGGSSRMMTESG